MANDILVKVGADISDFSRKMAESNKALSNFGKANAETFDAFKKTGAASVAMGAALAVGLGKSVKTAANFESAMSSVAAISGATGKDFELLSAKAREMGASTSFSASEAAEGLEYMALAGWDTKQMLGGIEPILHLAEAGALDLGRASDLVTDSMSALGLEVKDLDGYLDQVAKTSASANTDIDALMEAFVIAGGTFERFNVPLAEANAFLGVMANRGFKGSEAGTALNAIMTRLTASTGPSAKALKELGVNAYDSSGNFRGMEAVMKDVEKKLSGLTDKERAHYQTQIAGLNHGKAFSAMLSGLGDEYGDLKDAIIDSDGALIDMRNTMKDNLQGALENLSSAFEEMQIALGSALFPAIKVLVKGLQFLADKFNALPDSVKSFIAIGAALASVLLVVGGGFLMLIGFIPQIISGFAALKTVALVLGKVFMAINWPVTLVVGALVAGAVLIVKYWTPIKQFFTGIWKSITKSFTNAFNRIDKATHGWARNGIAVYKAKFDTIVKLLSRFWDYVKESFSNGLAFLKALVTLDFAGMKDIIGKQLNATKTLVGDSWNIIKDNMLKPLRDMSKSAKKTFADLYDWINNKTGGFFGYFIGYIKAQFDTAVEITKAGWSYIKDTFTNALKFLKGLVTLDFKAMGEAMTSQMETSKKLITNVWQAIKENIGKKLVEIAQDIRAKIPEWREVISEKMAEIREVIKAKVLEWGESILTWAVEIPVKLGEKILGWAEIISEKLIGIKDVFVEKTEEWGATIIEWYETMPDKILEKLEGWRDAMIKWTERQNEENIEQFGEWKTSIGEWFDSIPAEMAAWFKGWTTSVSEWFTEARSNISDKLEGWKTTLLGWFSERPGDIRAQLGNWWAQMGRWYDETKANIKIKLDGWWDTLKNWFTDVPSRSEVKDMGKNMIDKVSEGNHEKRDDFMTKLGRLIIDVVKAALAMAAVAIIAVGREIIRDLIKGIQSMAGKLGSKIRELGGDIADRFSEVDLFSIGADIIRGLVNGIGSMASAVWDKAKSIATGIGDSIKKALDIQSPSRVLMEIGKWTSIGLADGIEDYAYLVDKASDKLAESAVPDVNNIDMSYATPDGITARSLAGAVSRTVDVNSRDDRLINAIGSLERRLTNLEVVMDGEKVGRITRPHINEGNALDATVGRYFD